MTQATGILALWNNCAPGREAEYEYWYQTEHLHERLSVPGFLAVRRYQALEAKPRYFTFYETASPEVLYTTEYLDRLDDPTPLTQTIMSEVFLDMNRTACRRTICFGSYGGGNVLTVRTDQLPTDQLLNDWAAPVVGQSTLTRFEVWRSVVKTDQAPSVEEKLRGRDGRIESCLYMELDSTADHVSILSRLNAVLDVDAADVGLYGLICGLPSEPPAAAEASQP